MPLPAEALHGVGGLEQTFRKNTLQRRRICIHTGREAEALVEDAISEKHRSIPQQSVPEHPGLLQQYMLAGPDFFGNCSTRIYTAVPRVGHCVYVDSRGKRVLQILL